MSGYSEAVREVVRRIPRGFVVTYGQIAAYLGNPRGTRTVVWALHSSAEADLPYHRVVNQKGAMSPGHIFGGDGEQRRMLEEEGVTFTLNGCVDMQQHVWPIMEEEWEIPTDDIAE